jgi:hypothetical protein
MRASGLVYSRRPKCHRAIANQAQPKQVNRFQYDRTILAVQQTRRLMDSMPRQRHYGTPPRIRRPGQNPTMPKRYPSLTGLAKRRKSNGKERTRPDHRNSDRSSASRARPVRASAVGHQHQPRRIDPWRCLVCVLPNLTGRRLCTGAKRLVDQTERSSISWSSDRVGCADHGLTGSVSPRVIGGMAAAAMLGAFERSVRR